MNVHQLNIGKCLAILSVIVFYMGRFHLFRLHEKLDSLLARARRHGKGPSGMGPVALENGLPGRLEFIRTGICRYSGLTNQNTRFIEKIVSLICMAVIQPKSLALCQFSFWAEQRCKSCISCMYSHR